VTAFLNDWVAELRQGNRPQCKGRLTEVVDGVESFCCLGVAESMLVERGLQTRRHWDAELPEDENDPGIPEQYVYGDHQEGGVLTDEGCKALGLTTRNPEVQLVEWDTPAYNATEDDGKPTFMTLAQMNDAGFTFSQIADVIDYFFGGEK